MQSLVERAEAFGGRAAYEGEETIVLIPAASAAEFCQAEFALGNAVDFAECLYFYLVGGVEPSMELSKKRRYYESDPAFVAALARDALVALDRGATRRADAFFEIGVTEA